MNIGFCFYYDDDKHIICNYFHKLINNSRFVNIRVIICVINIFILILIMFIFFFFFNQIIFVIKN